MRDGEENGKSFFFPVRPGNRRGPTKTCSKITPAVIKDGTGERHDPARGEAVPAILLLLTYNT